MPVTIKDARAAFALYFEALNDRAFRKSQKLNELSEQQLHPLVRSFLLGYFGSVSPEVTSKLPTSLTGRGRIDYVVGNLAIEFAVRQPMSSSSKLSQITNATEIAKLVKWDGPALLVLYDFSRKPFSEEKVAAYREWQSLGKGNHKKSPFNVAYFFLNSSRETDCIQMNIGTRSWKKSSGK